MCGQDDVGIEGIVGRRGAALASDLCPEFGGAAESVLINGKEFEGLAERIEASKTVLFIGSDQFPPGFVVGDSGDNDATAVIQQALRPRFASGGVGSAFGISNQSERAGIQGYGAVHGKMVRDEE